ncbi:MAG: DUF2683 family protein [Nanoarchaeota archaeon]|nr:DUF2683 family protein [Nanoarchaeota archaeon]
MKKVSMNLHVSEYASRILGVIKEKFGLKDKSEALEKFADLFGEEFIDKEVKDEIVVDVIKSCEQHINKHGHRKMALKDLRKLCGVE